jgi:endonuclease YncB( thermonuclease family)
MKSKNDRSKELAYLARKRLYELITKIDEGLDDNIDLKISRKDIRKLLNSKVYLINILCGEFDKYGRLLGWLFDYSVDNNTLNKTDSYNHILIKEKLAYEYKGETKLTETEQIILLEE